MKPTNGHSGEHDWDDDEVEPKSRKCGLRIRSDDIPLHNAFERAESEAAASAEQQLGLPLNPANNR